MIINDGTFGLSEIVKNKTAEALKYSMLNRVDMLNCKIEHMVKEEMSHQFAKANFEKMWNMTTIEQNLFKRIIEMKSKVYMNPAIRKATYNDVDDDIYADIIYNSNIDYIMPIVEKLMNACNEVVVKVSYDKGRIRYDVLSLDMLTIEVNDDDYFDVLSYQYQVGARKKVKWEKSGKKILYDGSGLSSVEEINIKDESGNVVLPFVWFHRTYPYRELIDYSSGADLIDFTVKVNVLLTYVNYLMKMQSYKQPYITGRDIKIESALKWDPSNLMAIDGDNINLGYIDLRVPPGDLYDSIQKRIDAICANYNISPENFRLSGTPSSGYALKISNRQLDESINTSRAMLRLWESDLFDMTRNVWNSNQTDSSKIIDWKDKFIIDFAEIDYDESTAERDAHNVVLLNNNVITPLTLIMDENPDIDESQARAIYEKNKAINNQYKPLDTFSDLTTPTVEDISGQQAKE